MNEWMNEWTNKRMAEWLTEWMNGWNKGNKENRNILILVTLSLLNIKIFLCLRFLKFHFQEILAAFLAAFILSRTLDSTVGKNQP